MLQIMALAAFHTQLPIKIPTQSFQTSDHKLHMNGSKLLKKIHSVELQERISGLTDFKCNDALQLPLPSQQIP